MPKLRTTPIGLLAASLLLTAGCEHLRIPTAGGLVSSGGASLSDPSSLVGVVSSYSGLISANGSGIISNNASGIISTNGSQYRIADISQVPVVGATVELVDASGVPVPGVASSSTDASGVYYFPEIPRDTPLFVEAQFPQSPGSQELTYVRSEAEAWQADVDLASSIVGSKIQTMVQSGGLDINQVNPLQVDQLVQDTRSALNQNELPTGLTQSALSSDFDRVASASTQVAQDLSQITVAPASPAPSPTAPPAPLGGLFSDNFQNGLAQWGVTTYTGESVTLDPTVYINSNQSVFINDSDANPDGNPTTIQATIPGATGSVNFSGYFRVGATNLADNQTVTIARVFGTTGGYEVRLMVDGTGALRIGVAAIDLNGNATSIALAASPLTTNTWYLLDLSAPFNGPGAAGKLSINGNLVATSSTVDLTGQIPQNLLLGWTESTQNTFTGSSWWDDVVVSAQ